jgi:hypothetical protein
MMPFNSRNEVSASVSMTWRAISARLVICCHSTQETEVSASVSMTWRAISVRPYPEGEEHPDNDADEDGHDAALHGLEELDVPQRVVLVVAAQVEFESRI